MTQKDKETIQRALGIIEGAICVAQRNVRDMLATAVEMIDVVVAENAKATATHSEKERVRCADCKHIVFSDCYGECGVGHRGIVRPDDACTHGERRAE